MTNPKLRLRRALAHAALGAAFAASASLATRAAHAQGAEEPTAPPALPEPAPTAPSAPAAGQLAPSAGAHAEAAPQPATAPVAPASAISVTIGSYTCFVGEHDGFDAPDARTTALLVCREVERRKAPAPVYEVRLDKLGGQILLSVIDRHSGDSREMLVRGFDEVPVVSRRLVGALIEQKSVERTETVENIAGEETRAPRLKPGQVGFDMSIIGMSGVGMDVGMSAGLGLGLGFRLDRVAVTSHGRLGGIGSGDQKLAFGSLDVGARYYFSDEAIATFAGGGLQLAYFDAYSNSHKRADGSGLGAFGEIGVEGLRTGRVGLIASIRADAPFFELERGADVRYDPATGGMEGIPRESRYVVPLSLNLGIVLR